MQKLLFLVLTLGLLVGCSDDDNPIVEINDDDPTLTLSAESLTLETGDEITISLVASDFSEDVFGVSFQLVRSNVDVIAFQTDQTTIGPCLGDDAILFVQMDEEILYVAVTRVQGDDSWQENGTVVSFTITAENVGACTLSVDPDELVLYSETGDELVLTDLLVDELQLTVDY